MHGRCRKSEYYYVVEKVKSRGSCECKCRMRGAEAQSESGQSTQCSAHVLCCMLQATPHPRIAQARCTVEPAPHCQAQTWQGTLVSARRASGAGRVVLDRTSGCRSAAKAYLWWAGSGRAAFTIPISYQSGCRGAFRLCWWMRRRSPPAFSFLRLTTRWTRGLRPRSTGGTGAQLGQGKASSQGAQGGALVCPGHRSVDTSASNASSGW